MTAAPASAPAEKETPWRRDALTPVAWGLAVAVVVLASFWYERYQPWALALALAAFLALVDAVHLWTRNRVLTITLLIDLLLVFGYLWSLDESVHVVIQASAGKYTAIVGDNVLTLKRPGTEGWIGLDAGTMWDYRVQPTGEAVARAPSTLLERLGQDVRLATPKPAWANIIVRSQSGAFTVTNTSQLAVYSGTWTVNHRGELEGDLGSNALIRQVPAGNFTISADLMRPDGMQGILLDVNRALQGQVFAVRMDRPDAGWFVWDRTRTPATLSVTYIGVSTIAMIQRTVRLLLGNVIAGFLILLLTLPLYLLLQVLLRGDHGTERRLRRLRRALLGTRVLDAAALVMAAVGLVTAALFAWGQLQGIPHVQDSVAYLFQAKTLALGRLSVPTPRPYAFFQEEFIDNFHGQWFGKYPPGWPLLLAIGVLARVPWLVNPILGGICLVLIFLTGREVYGRTVAALGTALALSSPFFLFLAGSYMAHTATLVYAAGFAYLVVRWSRRRERGELATVGRAERTPPTPAAAGTRYPVPGARLGDREWHLLVPAGFLLGMAFITRQLDTIAFAAPLAVLLLWRPIVPKLLALRWVALGALPPAVFLLIYNRVLTGDPLRSPYALWWPWDTIGFSDNIQNGFGPALGFWNTSINVEYLMAHLFGWPFYLGLGIAAIPFLLGRANRWDAIFGASALAVIGAYIFYWNPGTMYGPRYYYVAIPWFALLVARGLEELYRWPMRAGVRLRPSRVAAVIVPALLLSLMLAYNVFVYLPAQLPMYTGYNFINADSLQAVDRAGIHHALVFVVSVPADEWWSYGSVFSANSPALDGDVVYARYLGKKDAVLMRKYPGRTFYRLQGTAMTRIGGR